MTEQERAAEGGTTHSTVTIQKIQLLPNYINLVIDVQNVSIQLSNLEKTITLQQNDDNGKAGELVRYISEKFGIKMPLNVNCSIVP